MAERVSSNAGSCGAFEYLPDHLLLQILSRAAKFSNGRGGLHVSIHKLCQLRTTCSRFYKMVSQAEDVSWRLKRSREDEVGAIQFLQENQGLKSLSIISRESYVAVEEGVYVTGVNPLQDAHLYALGGVTSGLEHLEISANSIEGGWIPDTVQIHGLFRTLARFPRLKSFKLDVNHAPLRKPLSTRFAFKCLKQLHLESAALADSSLASILNLCPNLEGLNVTFSRGLERPVIESKSLISLNTDGIMSESMRSLHVRAPNLRSLTVACVEHLSIEAPDLVDLELDQIEHVTCGKVSKLERLRIYVGKMVWHEVFRVLQLGSEAKSLSLSNFWLLEDLEVPAHHQLLPCTLGFPKLEKLTLVFDGFSDQAFEFAHLKCCLKVCEVARSLQVVNIKLPEDATEKFDLLLIELLAFQREYPLVKVHASR